MSRLAIYPEPNDLMPVAEPYVVTEDGEAIAVELHAIGVRFERWQAGQPLVADADEEAVLAAYRPQIDALMAEYGFQAVDVVSLTPAHPDKDALRAKFLDEHTHADFEVRFFVQGQGMFYLHADGKVYTVLCEAGDLISVPAGTAHWFDMGAEPDFRCIRLFTTPEGWVAQFTGSDIAGRYPRLEA